MDWNLEHETSGSREISGRFFAFDWIVAEGGSARRSVFHKHLYISQNRWNLLVIVGVMNSEK